MSDLVKDAIADAKILKEMAMKNAESIVVEKYAPQIREAVSQILEQGDEGEGDEGLDLGGDLDFPEDEMPGEEGITMTVGGEGTSDIADDVPLAAAEGEKLCQCPEEDEEIEIDFDELERQMSGEGDGGDVLDRAEVADEIVPDEDLLEEDIQKAINEVLEVDIKPVPTGQAAQNTALELDNAEKALAKMAETNPEDVDDNADDDAQEKLKDLQMALNEEKKLREKAENTHSTLLKEHNLLKKKYDNLKNLSNAAKDKLLTLNTVNARLHYANRILKDPSLNERQKEKIAESLSKASSTKEAKFLFEMLTSTMEKESLNEAIEKRSKTSMLIKSSKRASEDREKQDFVPTAKRFQKLAGIK